MPKDSNRWQFWIDRGGTFTDIVARAPDGRLLSSKLLSDNPEHYPDATVEGIRCMLDLKPNDPIPAEKVASIKLGTTVATNALLERKGERTVLVITRGLADVLKIGTQQRPRLFDLKIVLPEPLYERVVEVDGRFSAGGEELQPLNLIAVRDALKQVRAQGIRAAAIVCLHGYRYPQHEQAIAEIARELGFSQVSTSHETSQLINLVNRGDTTVVDAYLSPVLRRYVDGLRQALPGIPLFFMQSNGGLVDAARFQGKNAILSGPAGGIVGAAKVAARAGIDRVIGFDMGGTTTDVTHFAGELERRFETEVAGVRICVPMMHIHTVAAGGGSICWFDGARLRVGPESAGANPGPAAYRREGPLTVTDCNVMLGRLPPDFFPKIFGPSGDLPLDKDRVAQAFRELGAEIQEHSRKSLRPDELAAGFLRIAVENMANAIKKISVARGYDVTKYTLVTFGGAAGQHACAVADALRMERVLIHPLAGVLSAFGIGQAELRALRESSLELPLSPEGVSAAELTLASLEEDARQELRFQHSETESVIRKFHVRYQGTNTALPVAAGSRANIMEAFQATHRARFGFTMDPEERGLVIAAVSVEAIGVGRDELLLVHGDRDSTVGTDQTRTSGSSSLSVASTIVRFGESWRSTQVFDRETLAPGSTIVGPALVSERTTITVIEPGWQGEITEELNLVLTRIVPRPFRTAIGREVDPVLLEVFNNLFMSIAEQMGGVLQSSAYSVNIKERLDFSCALFDAEGRLVANAPHIPVHLGSMGGAVRAIMRKRGDRVRTGDVFALNDPFAGGTHLPDITVVTPVFLGYRPRKGGGTPEVATPIGLASEAALHKASGERPAFWVASRGHHADVGGITPGSMPPNSKSIDEEGIRITDFLLVEEGRFRERELIELLSSGPCPARNIPQNIGDLHAQIAANEKGGRELKALVEQFGLEGVRAYMDHVRSNAAEQVRQVIDRLKPGRFVQRMDSGAEIHVRIDVDIEGRRAVVDFSGTSAQRSDNFNAPTAIVNAVVLYVFRTLIKEEIPLNDGCLDALEIVVPKGSMLAPEPPAAVVAGNVETSQALANALYGALGVVAAGQGTMNNLIFGNDRYQYYETIGGGAGAGPDFAGASAVHTHMTNTRLTDPEVLELRYPVRLEAFQIRQHSGGAGRWGGGDGIVRKLRFREPMQVVILANHRIVPPFGLDGGDAGKVGRTSILRKDGSVEVLSSSDQRDVAAGDAIVVETPGGGGWGVSSKQ
ncbi:MAG: hydantoinase B/oxoprolinase family protein [Verrucomicrobia bacterium]|nr:hydantoinase B/oxoprolinase family protein [Verrucomicrobiota bacterium]